MVDLDMISRAVKIEYLLDKIIQSSEDCELSYAMEYVNLISKNDEFSVYLYTFCTNVARSKNHKWTRIIGKYYSEQLLKAYKKIILWESKDYNKETDTFHTPYTTLMNSTLMLKGKTYSISLSSEKIYDYLMKMEKHKYELEWKNIRGKIKAERILRDFV